MGNLNLNHLLRQERNSTSKIKKLIDLGDIDKCESNQVYINVATAVIKTGMELFPNFHIDRNWQPIYKKLVYYFTGNEGGYPLDKSIWLFGTYGIGKTVTMLVFRKFLATYFPFSMNGFATYSTEDIWNRFKENNGDISFLGRRTKGKQRIIDGRVFNDKDIIRNNICLHEFGKSVNDQYFGSTFDQTIDSLMMTRYQLFQEEGIMTHITSNFSPAELTRLDGATVDRLAEMYKFIKVNGESKRC